MEIIVLIFIMDTELPILMWKLIPVNLTKRKKAALTWVEALDLYLAHYLDIASYKSLPTQITGFISTTRELNYRKMKTMKTSILLSLLLLSLAACQKNEKVTPTVAPITSTTTTTTPTPTAAVKPDTIPDQAAFKIQLFKDSINTDETMFIFSHTSKTSYTNNDAVYFQGFGQESLASISSDGKDLAINGLPYTPGMSIALDANTKASGAFLLKLSYENKIPANIHIWLKDALMKDSVDVRTTNYNFNVDKTNANSFGNKRFKLILNETGK